MNDGPQASLPEGAGPAEDSPAESAAEGKKPELLVAAGAAAPAETSRPPTVPAWQVPAPTTLLGNLVAASLACVASVYILQAGTSVVTITRASQREPELGASLLFFADGWETGLYLGFTLLLAITGIMWLIWQRRAHSNLIAMQHVRFRPSVVWWWVVPVASLFMPYLAISELAESGSDRPWLRRTWWGFFLASNTASIFLLRVPEQLGAGVVMSEMLSIGAGLLGLIAAVLAIGVIRMVDRGIAAKRGATGWPVTRQLRLKPLVLVGAGSLLLSGAGAATAGVVLPLIARNLPVLAVSTFDIPVGGCFNETEDFPEVDCNQPHDAEVYVVEDYPDQSAYPGDKALIDWAEPLCRRRFETYTGVPYPESPLGFGYLNPTAEGWVLGDREIVCYLFDPSDDELTAPIRGDAPA